MILVLCIDENKGLSFGGKRQSRDRFLIRDLLALTEGKKLWIAPGSALLFEGAAGVRVSEKAAAEAGEGDYVFLEKGPLPREGVEGVVLYHWNRRYPATEFMTLDLSAFSQGETVEFPGSSHEKITREIYMKQEVEA